MKKVFSLYRNAFGGLSHAAWMLSLIMFINRSGAMVIPFLGVYLTGVLGYTLKEAGAILSIYGLGSVCGSFLGGWLTDRVGHFKVQFFSLTIGGSLYFMFLHLQQFEHMAAAVFILSLVNDTLRPANASSVASYAKPENVTRAFSLNRMAINLGFSIGPALGGLLAAISYNWLFIADGATCIMAGLFFFLYFRNKQGHRPTRRDETNEEPLKAVKSPYQDGLYLIFVLINCGFAIVFFQFLSTLPIYYRDVYTLPEQGIGMLLGFNGLLVFSLEMIMVYLLGNRIKKSLLIPSGILLLGFSFVLLNAAHHVSILYVAMALLSIAEILVMPFMSTITVERSNEQNRGSYMGLYTISYAAAHVIAPYLGTTIASKYGFDTLWWGLGVLTVVLSIGIYFVVRRVEQNEARVIAVAN